MPEMRKHLFLDDFPDVNWIAPLGIFRLAARSLMTAELAAESTGGAVTHTFNLPMLDKHILFLLDRG